MKRFNVWCDKVISVEMDVVCNNKKELWDIVRYCVDFKNYGLDGDLVGIEGNNPNIKITCFEPDTTTKWWIHSDSECDDNDYTSWDDEDYGDENYGDGDEDEDDDEVGDIFEV